MANRRIRQGGVVKENLTTENADGKTGKTDGNGLERTETDGVRFMLFDNPEKSEKVISALRKIADGSEQETIPGLRNDLAQYGGTNDITFYWGNEKKGIYHIAYRRGVDTLLHVIDAVADGNINRFVKGNKTVILEKDGFEAVLALTEYGNQKSWLLSGWKTNVPDASGEVGTPSAATQLKPTFSRQELGAGIDSILPNSENVKSESEKNRKKDNLRFAVVPETVDNGKERAEMVVVPPLPVDITDTVSVRNYLYEHFKGREVEIKSDGRPVLFNRQGLEDTLKRRNEHRKSFSALDSIIEDSYPVGYETVDERHKKKRPDLRGQFIYAALLDLGQAEEYIATIKLDDTAADKRAFFKDISIKKRSLYVGQTQELNSANVGPSADRIVSIQQLVDFVKSDFAGSQLFSEKIPQKGNLRFSVAPEDEYKVAVAMPERYTTAEDMKSWLEEAVEGETDC